MDSIISFIATYIEGNSFYLVKAVNLAVNWAILLALVGTLELIIVKTIQWISKRYLNQPLVLIKRIVIMASLVHGIWTIFNVSTANGLVIFSVTYLLLFFSLAYVVYNIVVILDDTKKVIGFGLVYVFALGFTRYLWLKMPQDIQSEINGVEFEFNMASSNLNIIGNIIWAIRSAAEPYFGQIVVVGFIAGVWFAVKKIPSLNNFIITQRERVWRYTKDLFSTEKKIPVKIKHSGQIDDDDDASNSATVTSPLTTS